MHDNPIPDVNWTDEEIKDYAARFLPKLPVVYVTLAFQVDVIQPDTAKIECGIVTRFKRMRPDYLKRESDE